MGDIMKKAKMPLFEEKVRTSRILMIDEEIRSGAYPNSVSLARKVEVTSRTIQRDIEYLRDMYRAPVEYDYYRKGYYYAEENFFIKSIVLTEGELFSLALFDRLLEQYANTPLEKNLRVIFQKVRNSLPEQVSVNPSSFSSEASFIPDPLVSIDADVFEAIFTALKTRQTINAEYRSTGRQEYRRRTLDPYHAVCHRGAWYIIAFCPDLQDSAGEHTPSEKIRAYAFSRFKKVKLSGRHYRIPDDFNPHDYFDKEMGVYASSKIPYTFEFLVHKDAGIYALERYFHRTQEIRQNKDGSVLVKFTSTQIKEALRWVLSQGHTVKVLNPPELVKMVKAEIEKTRRQY
jgi:predicted DNA-binding transcriptional regulator YafY